MSLVYGPLLNEAALYDNYNKKTLSELKPNDWFRIFNDYEMSSDFISDYKDTLDISLVTRLYFQRYETIPSCLDAFDWHLICSDHKTTEEFLIKYEKYVHWEPISKRESMSLGFIRRYKDKLNWALLSELDFFTIEMLEEFKDYFNWSNFSFRRNIPEDILIKFQDLLNWTTVFRYSKDIPEKLIVKYAKTDSDWYEISLRQNLSCDFVLEQSNKIHIGVFIEENKNQTLSQNEFKLIEDIWELICTFGLDM